MRLLNIFLWALRILAVFIMLQTLYFKFSTHPQSVHLLTERGKDWDRDLELIASILILFPKKTGIGAVLGKGLVSGAVFFNLTKLGIVFDGDAWLFTYVLIVLIPYVILTLFYRKALSKLVFRRSE